MYTDAKDLQTVYACFKVVIDLPEDLTRYEVPRGISIFTLCQVFLVYAILILSFFVFFCSISNMI